MSINKEQGTVNTMSSWRNMLVLCIIATIGVSLLPNECVRGMVSASPWIRDHKDDNKPRIADFGHQAEKEEKTYDENNVSHFVDITKTIPNFDGKHVKGSLCFGTRKSCEDEAYGKTIFNVNI